MSGKLHEMSVLNDTSSFTILVSGVVGTCRLILTNDRSRPVALYVTIISNSYEITLMVISNFANHYSYVPVVNFSYLYFV
jgi:hypothetical protein